MDMLSFFQTVIPSEGVKFLAEFVPITGHPRGGIFVHHPFQDFEDMVDKAQALDAKGKTVYHACATYKEVIFKTSPKGREYPAGRTQSNAVSAKALWQDFDVGKYDDAGVLKPISYATRNDARDALKHLIAEVGLPTPLLVNSGAGFHAYWPFDKALPAAEWNELAALVRSVYQAVGVKFDPARDSDIASILRPVDTHNKGRQVTVLLEQTPRSPYFYKELFQRYAAQHAVPPPVVKAQFENEFGAGPREFPESSLALVAERCQQVQLFRDTGGGTEPLWWANLGVAKHCVDGEQLAHLWSEGYPGYDVAETQSKLDTWNYGPTTCEKFAQINSEGCSDCPFKGKTKSPIQLGYTEETPAPVLQEVTIDGEIKDFAPPHWPRSFTRRGDVVSMMLENKDGVAEPARVFSPLFYLDERIRGDDGTFIYTVRMNVRNNEWRRFEMPAKCLSELRAIKSYLAAYEIVVYNDKLLGVYMNAYAQSLRQYAEEINTYRQFGWNKELTGFLIGTDMITRAGRTKIRISTETIKDEKLLEAGNVKGTKEEWTKGVMELYGNEHSQPYQYAICTQFAAPLMALMDREEWNGIPLVLTSDKSGYGKTTVVKIGINALHHASKTTIAETTVMGIVGRASQMNSGPVLFDELTQQLPDPNDVARVTYTLSNGRPKIGLQANGKERDPVPSFKGGFTITANNNFNEKLAQADVDPMATQMRIFEIPMESYPKLASMRKSSKTHAHHSQIANHLMDNVYGVWADDYFRFIFEHKAEITDKLRATAMAITVSLGSRAAQERFYAYHMSCVLVAGWIAKRIGALGFDMTALKNWAYDHLAFMRGVANRNGANAEDQFSQFLAELNGSILVTRHYDTLDTKRGATEVPMLPIRGPVLARLALGSDKERGKFYISLKAVDDWCAKHNITPSQFKRHLTTTGAIRMMTEHGKGVDRKISLGRGVPAHPLGQSRCVEVEYAVAQGFIDDLVATDNVVTMKRADAAVATIVASVGVAAAS